MNLGDGKHDAELLKAQGHVWNHIFNFINSMSLKSAIELGIPDTIYKHGQPMTLSQLVAALNVKQSKSHSIYRLMRVLIQSGFFSLQKLEGEEEGYVLTSASQLLLKDNPLSVTPFLQAVLDPILIKPWHHVSSWFKNDDPTPFDTAHGRTFWDYAGHEPMLNDFFNRAMASDARLVINVVLNEKKELFNGLKSFVDVGGGTGTVGSGEARNLDWAVAQPSQPVAPPLTVGKAIAQAFPQLDCTVLDLPHVVAGLQDNANLKFVGGDMFQAVPPADAVLLKWILHDWNDEECVKILKQCKEAVKNAEGGRVIIIDMMMGNQKGDDESVETQLLFDMLMMILLTGEERNEEQWSKLFKDAGFSDYKITPILGLRSIIEVFP